jgi:hypothetical protein
MRTYLVFCVGVFETAMYTTQHNYHYMFALSSRTIEPTGTK